MNNKNENKIKKDENIWSFKFSENNSEMTEKLNRIIASEILKIETKSAKTK